MERTSLIPGKTRPTRRAWIHLCALLVACGDGGPSGPGDQEPTASPARLEVQAPDSLTEGSEFELTVTARTAAGQVATGSSGTVALSPSGGTIVPASLSLVSGSASAMVTITGVTGPLTLTARSGEVEGSTALTVLAPLDRLVGDPEDPAATAIPALEYRSNEADFTTGHPDLPGLPMAEDIVLLVLDLDATVGDANGLLQSIGAEIIGGLPGLADEVPGILMLRVPTGSHTEMESLLETLRADPLVETATQDALLRPDLVTRSNGGQPQSWEWASFAFGGNWGLKRVRAPHLWNLNPGVRKAIANGSARASGTLVLDGRFAPTHPDVAYRNLTPTEVGAHGTQVAGVIGAIHDNALGIDGLNPFAVLTAYGLGSVGDEISGYLNQVLADPTIRVVNTSRGYTWSGLQPPVDPEADPAAQAQVRRDGELFELAQRLVAARRPLPILVNSAGNDFGKSARFNGPQANAALERGNANIVVVEALENSVNSAGGASRWFVSNIDGHLSAPGFEVLSTGDSAQLTGYEVVSGTSFAAPHVAGLVGYLYTFLPGLPDPTLTSNPVRDLLVRTAVPVAGGGAPRIDAYAAVHEAGELTTIGMLSDLDDGTADGNTRVDPETGSPVLTTDADGDGGQGDGVVDMSDFRRWRDGYLFLADVPGLRLDGADDHPKKDLNANGEIDPLDEIFFPFVDLNGDNEFDPTAVAYLPGTLDAEVTDLQVLQQLFDDPHYDASDLDGLLESADIAIRPTEIEATNPAEIWSSVTAPGDNTPWEERFHSGLDADGEGLHQIYTVPVGSPGESWEVRVVALDAVGDTLFDLQESFALHPGEDHYWDPGTTSGIVYSDRDRNLWRMSSDGSGAQLIAPGPFWAPRWSPDGSRISAFQGGVGLVSMKPDGTDRRTLLEDLAGFPNYDRYSAWYPDGRAIIAFEDFRDFCPEGTPADRYVRIDASSGGASPLLTAGTGDVCLTAWMDWSPDGSWLYFVGWPAAESDSGNVTRRMYRWNGSDQPELLSTFGTEVWSLRVSPDGTRIAYLNGSDLENMSLQVRSLSTGSFVTAASGLDIASIQFVEEFVISWSPDGQQLIFPAEIPSKTLAGLWIVDADGSDPILLEGAARAADWR